MMKRIQSYAAKKYASDGYHKIEDGIFRKNGVFFSSLSFEQEPDLGEGTSALDISQYPLEDILDRFGVYVSDFYEAVNVGKSVTCYLEFASANKHSIAKLREIIGKHVYNDTCENNGTPSQMLVIQ